MRYPRINTALATGENVIELAYAHPAKVAHIHVIVTGEATVKADGLVLKPLGGYGNTKEYEHTHQIVDTRGKGPGIQSLVIEGDAVYAAELHSSW